MHMCPTKSNLCWKGYECFGNFDSLFGDSLLSPLYFITVKLWKPSFCDDIK